MTNAGDSQNKFAMQAEKQLEKKSEKDSEKERERIIELLIILLLLLLLLAFLFCLLMCHCKRGCSCKLSALITVGLKGPHSSGLSQWLRIIWHKLCLLWQFLKGQQILFGLLRSCAPRKDAISGFPNMWPGFLFTISPADMSLFLYIGPCPLLFFIWPYYRWVRHSIRIIYVTIIRPIIPLVKRQFMLWAQTSMGTKPDGHGFWSGFDNLIPPLMSVFTYHISYTSTTYAYTIEV